MPHYIKVKAILFIVPLLLLYHSGSCGFWQKSPQPGTDTTKKKNTKAAIAARVGTVDSTKIKAQQDPPAKNSTIIDSLNKQVDSLTREPGKKTGIKNDTATSDDPNRSLIALSAIAAALLLLVVFLYLKNRKMSRNDNIRKEMIEHYSSNVDRLKNYLANKGLLTGMAGVELNQVVLKIQDLIEKYTNEENRSNTISTEVEDLKAKLKQAMIENHELAKNARQTAAVVTPAVEFVPYINSAEASSFIKSQVVVSAGPRKDTGSSDTELGEDIAGTLSLPQQTFFWLLDGTSDSAAIKGLGISENDQRAEEFHIFSSRLLAQSLGFYIQKNISQCFDGRIPLNELLTSAAESVRQEWEKRINNEPAERKEAILQLIKKGFKPLCSTTLVLGRLLDNGHLYALRTGDSKIFPFKKANDHLTLDKSYIFSADPKEDYDRIAFRLDHDSASGNFVIRQNSPNWLQQSTSDVHVVFAFSDGIGRITEAQLSSDNPGIIEMIKQNIGRIPQKTHDDKSLIILERIITTGNGS